MNDEKLGRDSRDIIDANRYMVLGTAGNDGTPWVSPVWYAPEGYENFLWVSDPETRHSRNVAIRPEVAITIFDSTQPLGSGRGLAMTARAQELRGDECGDALRAFSRRSIEQGGKAWAIADIEPPSHLRLYRATAVDQFLLAGGEPRRPVRL